MVDSATGRINNTNLNISLESKHNITKEDTKIGHFQHKSRLFTKFELKFTSGPLDGSTDFGQLGEFIDPDELAAHTRGRAVQFY